MSTEHIKSKSVFGMVVPAPNPTGKLHLGHFLNLSVQDVICRWKINKGNEIKWASALDHGGSSTEYVVVKDEPTLRGGAVDEEIISNKIKSWVNEITPVIIKQITDMNLTIDNTEERSMIDECRVKEFRSAIERLADKGVLYQADKVVSWCARRNTFVDAADVITKQVETKLYAFVYVTNSGDELEIETSEPITLLNDKAIVVSSSIFESFKEPTNTIINPLGKTIDLFVEDEWLKHNRAGDVARIIPGHCQKSFLWALNKGCKIDRVFDEQGIVCVAPYEEMSRDVVRNNIIDLAKSSNLSRGMRTSIQSQNCYRISDAPIEQLLTRQCFLNVASIAKKTLVDIQTSKITVEPFLYRIALENYLADLSNEQNNNSTAIGRIKDICISQQTVWGTPIDANRANIPFFGEELIESSLSNKNQIATMRLSCALWAFSAPMIFTRDPEQLSLLGKNSTCVTGMDLITFWIAPILMLSHELGFTPFSSVYIHPLICDIDGNKMSKSLGNTKEPDELVSQFGIDAVRLSLMSSIDDNLHRVTLNIDQMQNISNKLENVVCRINDHLVKPLIRNNYSENSRVIDSALAKLNITEAASTALQAIDNFLSSNDYEHNTINALIDNISPFAPVTVENILSLS